MSGVKVVEAERPAVPGPVTDDTFTPGNEIESFYETVSGRRNVLHDYNTYSYNFTLASLSKNQLENPDSYKGRVFTGGAETNDFFIVARSGGFKRAGPADQPDPNFIGPPTPQQIRQSFKIPGLRDKDLYIENVRFETRVGINNIGSSNLTRGSFEILEPYSSTGFYTTLFNASVFAGHPNYLGAPFLLVLTFFGRKVDSNDGEPEVVDKGTRYLPIRITKSDMTVTEQGSRYTVEFIGFNQTMNSAVHSTTKADINGPTSTSTQQHANQTVGVVLMDFFKKHQESYEDFYRQQWENANKEGSANIKKQLAERVKTANQLAAVGGTTVNQPGPNNTHKYSIWFPPGYALNGATNTTDFPDNMNGLKHSQFTGIRDTTLASGATAVPAGFKNFIMIAGMLQGDLGRTGGRNVPAAQEENDRLQGEIDDKIDELREIDGVMRGVRTFVNAELTRDIEQLRNTMKPELRDQLATDPNAEVSEKTDDQILESLNLLLGNLNNLVDILGVPSGPALGPNDPRSQAILTATLRDKVKNNLDRFTKAKDDEEKVQKEIEDLRKQQQDNRGRGRAFHTGDIPWSWKQGIDIKSVINTVVLESTYASRLQRPSELQTIQNTGMVDWFKIDTFQNIIGFDPFTMDYIYEFNYVVVPYKIHYSKLPGLNIVFKTDYLKKRAVREYNYLYTGKNLDVLDFGLNYNNLFFSPYVMRGPQDDPLSGTEEDIPANPTKLDDGAYPNTIEAVQNMLVTGYSMIQPVLRKNRPVHNQGVYIYPNEVAQAFQDFLFQPIADQALLRAQIKIIGDPVYVLGSGISDRPTLQFDDIETTEGEMNAFTKEVDIIFKFQNINDLPSASELSEGQGQPEVNINRYNGVYQVLAVNNFFEEGQFYQELSTLRRPNQPGDFETEEPDRGPNIKEKPDPRSGNQAPEVGGNEQDGQTDEKPGDPADKTTFPSDLIPTVIPNSPVARLIRSIAEEKGISQEAVINQLGAAVQDKRRAGIDLSGRGAEATTREIVSAASLVYPDLFPSGKSVDDILGLFNSPLPTQDFIRQNISTPGDPRPNILDVINAGQDVYNRYASLLSGGGIGTGSGSIRLNDGARRYWGSVPGQEKSRLFDLANTVDFPLVITSSQRPTRYNADLPGASPTSAHLTGNAFDIGIGGLDYNQKVALIRNASAAGYTEIILYDGHLHVATGTSRRGHSNPASDKRFDPFLDQHEQAPLTSTNPGN